MKKMLLTVGTSLIILGFILFSLIQQKKELSIHQTYFYLGTVIDLTLYETSDEDILKELSQLILAYDQQFDRNNKNSEVATINHSAHNQYLEISPSTAYIIKKALDYGQLSQGYFDITINPIVDLWQIGTENQHIPSSHEIEVVLPFVGYDFVDLKDNTVQLSNSASIDLGGIAKGFIADEIAAKLKSKGINRALINLGGNVYAMGNSPKNKPWNVGIRHPEPEQSGALLKISVENKSVVTSGITERYFEENGVIYHHIFNPFTGYPIQNDIISLSVISNHSIDGDALSTSLFALGVKEAFETVESLDNVQIIVVTKDKNIYYSASLTPFIELFDGSYQLIKK